MTASAAAGPRQGENLFMGTRTAYSYADMIGLLVDERRYFRPGRFPTSAGPATGRSRPLHADHLADVAAGRLRHGVQSRQRLSGLPLPAGGQYRRNSPALIFTKPIQQAC